MSDQRTWIVSTFDEPEKIKGTLDDLHAESFQQVGVLIGEEAARRGLVNLDGMLLEHVTGKDEHTILAGGLAELHPEQLSSGGGIGAALEGLGMPREEVALCLESIDCGHAVVIVRADDRYSEGLAILNTHGAIDTVREAQC
ncbi:MAG: hypothetical protein AB7K24_25115 [Gemmataceae bacterium]